MTAYLEEIKHLENWCQENNLLLNVSKTKELIVDCSKKQERHYQPVRISGTTVERVDSFRYLGVHISQDLSWSRHTSSLAKKARQRLYHLRRLRDFRLPSKHMRPPPYPSTQPVDPECVFLPSDVGFIHILHITLNKFTEAVVGFIGKLVDDTIPRITIKKFSNQKPWVDRTIREALNSRTAAYNAGGHQREHGRVQVCSIRSAQGGEGGENGVTGRN
ncbi:hypothetical protein P4O66_020952 [Electrophorus voltai]|uniref:Alkylated DNA repair protein AlkB homologue 8 N-terminal domain-containing protein n=1 Tax=Electrophorus voltai TaxID=2609070 RepID=A0AAD9E638_9TELE|nr:hypothetical protein P4O66_020952 [Electrophorus voltai]